MAVWWTRIMGGPLVRAKHHQIPRPAYGFWSVRSADEGISLCHGRSTGLLKKWGLRD